MTSSVWGAPVTLNDDFEAYSDNAGVQAAWTASSGGPTLINLYDPTPTPLASQSLTKNGRFNNVVAYRSFTPVTGVNWSLSVDVLSEAYSRSQAFGVFDASGVNGYLVRWNTTNVNNNSGNGLVMIYRRGDSANTPYNNTNRDQFTGATGTATGALISSTPNSTHAVTGYPVVTAPTSAQNDATYGSFAGFAQMELRYTAATSTLALYVDGAASPLISVVDTNVSTFSRVYLSGNTAGVFDNVEFTAVPEPASLTSLGLCALLLRRRRVG